MQILVGFAISDSEMPPGAKISLKTAILTKFDEIAIPDYVAL